MKGLIVFPLIMLMCMSLLSMMGLGTAFIVNSENSVDETYVATQDGWYDSTGHIVADRWEGTVGIGEPGGLHTSNTHNYWMNETNVGANGWKSITMIEAAGNNVYLYPVYDLLNGSSLEGRAKQQNTLSFDTASTYGIIALVIGLMALAAIAGLRVFGSGISESSVSTIIKGTAFLSLWALFSITSIALIVAIPLIGPIFYFGLTGMYTFGVVGAIGGGGDDL